MQLLCASQYRTYTTLHPLSLTHTNTNTTPSLIARAAEQTHVVHKLKCLDEWRVDSGALLSQMNCPTCPAPLKLDSTTLEDLRKPVSEPTREDYMRSVFRFPPEEFRSIWLQDQRKLFAKVGYSDTVLDTEWPALITRLDRAKRFDLPSGDDSNAPPGHPLHKKREFKPTTAVEAWSGSRYELGASQLNLSHTPVIGDRNCVAKVVV